MSETESAVDNDRILVRRNGVDWVNVDPMPVALGDVGVPPEVIPVTVPPWEEGLYDSPDTGDFVFVLRNAIPADLVANMARIVQDSRRGLNAGRQHIVGIAATHGPREEVHRPEIAGALQPLAQHVWDTVTATYAAGAQAANVDLRPFGPACGYSSCAVNRGIGVERVHEHSATNMGCVGLAVLRSHGSCLDFPRLGLRVQQCDGDIIIFSAATWHANSHVGGLRVTSAFYTVRRAMH